MNDKLTFFINRLLQLSLIIAGGFLLYQLSKPIDDWVSITEINGMKQLTANEVYAELEKAELGKKSFLGINPLKINKELKKHPLIEKVTSRRFLYPKKRIKIYIEETSPWAFYDKQVVANTGYVIARMNDPELSSRIKEFFLSIKNTLVQISSHKSIDQDKLLILRSLTEIIEGSTGQRIIKIIGDNEENFSLKSKKLDFRVGLLKNNVLKRVERLSLVNEQIEQYKKQLDYVDLSLSTSEVILGKRKGKTWAQSQIIVKTKKHKPELENLDPFSTPDEELGGELEPSHG